MDVARHRQQVHLVLNELCLEAALEQVARAAVLIAPIQCVGREQPLHETRQVGARRAQERMDMVVHEHKSIENDPALMQVVRQLREKSTPVVIAVENVRPTVTPAGDMIHGICKINPWWTWHAQILSWLRLPCNL